MGRYRLNEEKAEWIIYLTDVGQREHFEMLFTVSIKFSVLYLMTLCALWGDGVMSTLGLILSISLSIPLLGRETCRLASS